MVSFPIEEVQVIRAPYPSSVYLPETLQTNCLVQYIHPEHLSSAFPLRREAEHLLLAGTLFLKDTDSEQDILAGIIVALCAGSPPILPDGDYCGCLVTPQALWLFASQTTTRTFFYSQDRNHLQWSTDPRDLVTSQDLDNEALLRCCTGMDTFAYTGIKLLDAGTILRIDAVSGQCTRTACKPLFPVPLPRRVALLDLATLCFQAMIEATRPLASIKRKIGVLLSGGIDSAVVVAALAHHGVDLTAYHFQFASPAADESGYARLVCQTLRIPFVPIQASIGADYLSETWRYPHPYNHGGMRWFEQVADQARQDGISIMVTGRGGDLAFGPLATYGISDVFTAPIAWQEKWAMVLGALSTDWFVPSLLKSLRHSSLIDESSLVATSGSQKQQGVPFLRQLAPSATFPNLYDMTRFSPQDLALEATIWQPRGIRVIHPYHHPVVQQLAASLPTAYRLLPFRGMRVTKPVLRLAFASVLPAALIRHRRGAWSSVPSQEYCLTHLPTLLQLIGSPTSHLVQRGLVYPEQLTHLFSATPSSHDTSQELRIRAYTKYLIACGMTELFLRQCPSQPFSLINARQGGI
jgi:hypothetical protein